MYCANAYPLFEGGFLMSEIKFVKKTPAGTPGNWNWEYTCKCGGGTVKKNVVVSSANENEAKQLAQQECDDSCDEA